MQSFSKSSFGAVFWIESFAFGTLYCWAIPASRSPNNLYTSV